MPRTPSHDAQVSIEHSEAFRSWLAALENRHLANLRTGEVTRALRALSSLYVERRRAADVRGALDSAGKRAAFALFYGPLHFLATHLVVNALGARLPAPSSILDIGCGTGAAGAAFAVACGGRSRVVGIDRHPWAAAEAAWTYRQFGLSGHARRGDVSRFPRSGRGQAVVAAYVLNELAAAQRERVEDRLIAAAAAGARVLVLEPVARAVAPWWPDSAARVAAVGGRADLWRFTIDRTGIVAVLDRAAGLDHRTLTVRTLYCPGGIG